MMIAYQVLFLIVAISDLVIAVGAYRKKERQGTLIGNMMITAAAATFSYLGSLVFRGYFPSSVCSSIYFIGIDVLLLSMLCFVLEFVRIHLYTGRPGKVLVGLMMGWFAFDVAVLCINPFAEIALSYEAVRHQDIIVYQYRKFMLYDMHLLYCYCLVALIAALLTYKILKTPIIYRSRYRRILYILLFIVLLNVFYLMGSEYVIVDLSMLFYSVAGMLIYTNVFLYSPRGFLLETRSYVMGMVRFPIAVFDYEDSLVDCNRNARKLFPDVEDENGQLRHLCMHDFYVKYGLPEFDDDGKSQEWSSEVNGELRVYLCESHTFRDERQRLIGKMLLMRDMTYQRDPITGLDTSTGLYRYLSSLSIEEYEPIQLLCLNINSLSTINRALGRESGNEVMRNLVGLVRRILGPETYLASMDNGNIVAVLFRMQPEKATAFADRIRKEASGDLSLGFHYNVEYGIAEANAEQNDIYEVLEEATQGMQNRKLLSKDSHDSMLIHSLTQTLLESDFETEAHVERTRQDSVKLARALGLTDRECGQLELLCMLHDIGKVGIPTSILLKPGKLDPKEWEIMKTHAEKGYRIAMASPELEPVANLILHHHERWDGNGYPGRLRGEQIPLLSRIITVLDSYDVMTHDRPYHKAISEEAAKAELRRCSGSQFDPKIVETYLRILDGDRR